MKAPDIPIIVLAAMHLLWGLTLQSVAEARSATPVSELVRVFTPSLLPWLLYAAAILAVAERVLRSSGWPWWLVLAMLTPQQILITLSAGAGLYAMHAGHYADGTVITPAAILVDQLPVVSLATGHLIATLTATTRLE